MVNESIKDPLTGVYNYEYFQSRMIDEIQRSNRYSKPYSVVRFDIDHLLITFLKDYFLYIIMQ